MEPVEIGCSYCKGHYAITNYFIFQSVKNLSKIHICQSYNSKSPWLTLYLSSPRLWFVLCESVVSASPFFERRSFLQCEPCTARRSVPSRGMEKIIRRNVWGTLKNRAGRLIRQWERGARANFFLMNSKPLAPQCCLIARPERTYGLCLEGATSDSTSSAPQ